jgi:putative Holliday junction resolvase
VLRHERTLLDREKAAPGRLQAFHDANNGHGIGFRDIDGAAERLVDAAFEKCLGGGALVIGLPLTLDGGESEWTREVRRFGERLSRRTGLALYWVDERLTSVEAERAVRASGLPRAKREQKDRIDTAAAMIILQRFLTERSGG